MYKRAYPVVYVLSQVHIMKKETDKKEISFIDSSERRRKSFFGFTDKYPDRLKSVKYDKKQPKRRRIYITLSVLGIIVLFTIGYFVTNVILNLSYMPV